MNQPTITLDLGDAAKIAALMQWLQDWFASDPDLASSMRRFSFGLITLAEISGDLDHYAFILGHQP